VFIRPFLDKKVIDTFLLEAEVSRLVRLASLFIVSLGCPFLLLMASFLEKPEVIELSDCCCIDSMEFSLLRLLGR